MPTVSVIIPTYNRASMVKEAIQSVLDQTYSDYEVIVVDDGSTDHTGDVVSALRKHSNKIRYIYQKNKGRSAARNAGIRAAQGRYVAFLDSDDVFLPEKLSVQVSALESKPDFGMAYSYVLGMDEQGRVLEGSGRLRGRLSGWVYPRLLFMKGTMITTPSVMVRAEILTQMGGFDQTMHVCEDLDLWARIARRYKVLQIREPLAIVRYRQRKPGALSENLEARTLYYQKAIAADPGLTRIQAKLFSEMYCHYGADALLKGDRRLAYRLLVQSASCHAPEFLTCAVRNMVGFVRFRVALLLRRCLSPAIYSRLRQIYRGLVN